MHRVIHDHVVDQLYDHFSSIVQDPGKDVRWDNVGKEVEYRDVTGVPRGDMDICLIDKTDRDMLYIEVKTNYGDTNQWRKQVEQAQEHIVSYDVHGTVYRNHPPYTALDEDVTDQVEKGEEEFIRRVDRCTPDTFTTDHVRQVFLGKTYQQFTGLITRQVVKNITHLEWDYPSVIRNGVSNQEELEADGRYDTDLLIDEGFLELDSEKGQYRATDQYEQLKHEPDRYHLAPDIQEMI